MHHLLKLSFSFWRLPVQKKGLLLEAAFFLITSRLALKLCSFQRISSFLTRPQSLVEVVGVRRESLKKEVTWGIYLVSKHLPLEMVCFPRAIAAQEMLRRRRVNSTLYYGAATLPDQGLAAHVWLQDDDLGVIGHTETNQYKVLARYPR